MDIKQTLEQFGLDGKKAEVYLASLQLGSASAQEIAKRAGLKRPTVVEILEGLVRRGLVSFVTEKRTRLFTAEPPRKLLATMEEQARQARAILPDLEAIYGTSRTRPSVKLYEGVEGIKTVFEDTLSNRDRCLKAILSIQDIDEFVGSEWFSDYTNKRIASGSELRVIRSEEKEVGDKYPSSKHDKRTVHLAPKEMVFTLSVYLYDNKVSLIGTKKEHFGVIIESEEFHQTMSHLFDVLWQVTRVAKAVD